jgi:hypothetical protein
MDTNAMSSFELGPVVYPDVYYTARTGLKVVSSTFVAWCPRLGKYIAINLQFRNAHIVP